MLPARLEDAVQSGRIDIKALTFVRRHGGRVSVRQLTRSLATCRTVADAEPKLAAMVEMGMGVWTYSRPGTTGGRPSRLFVLTLPRKDVDALLRMSCKATDQSPLRGPRLVRQIARDLVLFMNRYPHTPCHHLLEAMAEVTGILTQKSKSPGEHMLRVGGRRYIRMNARGRVSTTWRYP